MLGGEPKEAGGVGLELTPPNCLEGRGDHAANVGYREAERLGAAVDADQAACASGVFEEILRFF
jgi:hypothetical protein